VRWRDVARGEKIVSRRKKTLKPLMKPPSTPSTTRLPSWLLGLLFVPLLGAGGWYLYDRYAAATPDTKMSDPSAVWRLFVRLKLEESPDADDLLAPAPSPPRTAAEAHWHNVETVLRQARRFASLPRVIEKNQFEIRVRGRVTGEFYLTTTDGGVGASVWQALESPSVVVEVVEGKIRGVSLLLTPPNEGEQICQRFARLRNTGDPEAEKMLGPGPDVPERPVTPAEAELLDAQAVLHQPCKIRAVNPLQEKGPDGAPRFDLLLKGNAVGLKHTIQTPTGPSSGGQRILIEPALTVELRDGKLHAVRVGLDPG
jgi:hypothetical protein